MSVCPTTHSGSWLRAQRSRTAASPAASRWRRAVNRSAAGWRSASWATEHLSCAHQPWTMSVNTGGSFTRWSRASPRRPCRASPRRRHWRDACGARHTHRSPGGNHHGHWYRLSRRTTTSGSTHTPTNGTVECPAAEAGATGEYRSITVDNCFRRAASGPKRAPSHYRPYKYQVAVCYRAQGCYTRNRRVSGTWPPGGPAHVRLRPQWERETRDSCYDSRRFRHGLADRNCQ